MASVGRSRPWMMRPHLDAVILSRLAHSGKADSSTSGTGVDGRWFCHSCACLSSGSLSLGQGLNLLLPCFELSLKCRAPTAGVYDQMEQLFTNRKFHFCSHRNFRVFFLNGKRPLSTRLTAPGSPRMTIHILNSLRVQ